MPRIPLAPINASLDAGGVGPQASLAAAGAPGQAISQAGGEIASAAFAFEQERQERQVADLQTKAAIDLADFEEGLREDQNFESYETRLQEFQRNWRAENTGGLTAQQQDALTPSLVRINTDAGRRVRQQARKRQIDVSRADLAANLTAVTDRYAQSDDVSQRQQLVESAVQSIQTRVANGVLTAEEGQTELQSLRQDLGEIDARAAMAEDPRGFLEALDDTGTFPMLQGERRQIWAERAGRQVDALDRQEEKALESAERERDKVEKQMNADLFAVTDLQVSRGEIGYPRVQELVDEGRLSIKQGADLFKRIDARFDKQAEDQQEIARVATILAEDGLPLDPRNKDDRNAAELYWSNVVRPALANVEPDQYNATAADFVGRTNIVPLAVQGRIRSGLVSTDIPQRVQAADLLKRLEGLPSGALQRSFNQKDIASGLMIADLVDAGIAPQEAVRRVDRIVDPENTALMNERRQELADAKPETEYENWITDFFDTVWTFAPDLPRTGGVRARVIDEFGDSFESWFLLTGDQEQARKLALEDIGQVWGVTEISGSFGESQDLGFGGAAAEGIRVPLLGGSARRIMKYPPERVYGFPGADNSWISEQLVSDVQAAGGGNVQSVEDVFIISDSVTAREFSAGSPTYQVLVRDENGTLVRPRDAQDNLLRWRPDIEAENSERQREIEESKNAARADWTARKQQQLLLGTSPVAEITGGGS